MRFTMSRIIALADPPAHPDRIDDVGKGIDSYQSPSLVVRSLGAVEMMAVRWLGVIVLRAVY